MASLANCKSKLRDKIKTGPRWRPSLDFLDKLQFVVVLLFPSHSLFTRLAHNVCTHRYSPSYVLVVDRINLFISIFQLGRSKSEGLGKHRFPPLKMQCYMVALYLYLDVPLVFPLLTPIQGHYNNIFVCFYFI
jgi:hypothetical protein